MMNLKTIISNSKSGQRTTFMRRNPTNAPQSAFTMIEIAISIAIIGFALVAIIGVLPRGLDVQKNNRGDTVINQDGPYFLEAIRSGAEHLDYLTNHVESIAITNWLGAATGHIIYTNSPSGAIPADFDRRMMNGLWIIGLLSTPKYTPTTTNIGAPLVTNQITANIRALTGPAVEQGGTTREFAFRYQMLVEIVPFTFFQEDSTNFGRYPTNTVEWITRSNRYIEVSKMANNLSELRLTCRWPLYPNGTVGNSRQVFRTLISATQKAVVSNAPPYLYFFQPESFNNK